MIIFRLRCTSKAHFIAWAKARGFMKVGKDMKGNDVDVCVAGFDFVEMGPITQAPAVYDKPLGDPTRQLVTAAMVDTAWHCDCRLYGALEAAATAGRTQTTTATVDGRTVTVTASIFDRTDFGALLKTKTAVTARTVSGIKVAAGYNDTTAGVALIEPTTPRHEWC